MNIESNRLYITPLLHDEVGLLAEDITALENKLDLSYKGEPIIGHLLDVTRGQYKKIQSDQKNFLWHTFWMFVLKDVRTIIGSFCFKGLPDTDGVVEIGYGINDKYQNKGYTSEAVYVLSRWALNQDGVKSVIAETYKDNKASQRVLEKCCFKIYRETTDSYWWRAENDIILY